MRTCVCHTLHTGHVCVTPCTQAMLTPDMSVISEVGDSWFNTQKLKLPRGCDYEMQVCTHTHRHTHTHTLYTGADTHIAYVQGSRALGQRSDMALDTLSCHVCACACVCVRACACVCMSVRCVTGPSVGLLVPHSATPLRVVKTRASMALWWRLMGCWPLTRCLVWRGKGPRESWRLSGMGHSRCSLGFVHTHTHTHTHTCMPACMRMYVRGSALLASTMWAACVPFFAYCIVLLGGLCVCVCVCELIAHAQHR